MNRMLTTKQVAEILHMTADRCSRFIRRNELGIKVGRQWLVNEEDLERFLSRQAVKDQK